MTEKDRINNSQAAGYEVMSVLSDIASYLAAGLSTDEILEGIIGTLKRKLPLSRCTIGEFEAIRNADAGAEADAASTTVTRKLVHAEEFFGLLEAHVEETADPRCCDEV